MVETIKKLLVNVQQHFTEAEKLQGRANLGCAASEDIPTDVVKYTSQTLTDAEKAQALQNIDAAKNALASSSNNGLMSSSDKTKLDAIQAGAEANVQSDWNQTDSSADDYIKNKPTIAAQVNSDWKASGGVEQILNKPNFQRVKYGSTSSELTGLKFDANNPEGYVHVILDSDQQATGQLVTGPYKTLLDSGVGGSKGDADHGIFINANGVFQECTNAVLFKCTLSTTFAELKAAISAGKIPFLVTASKVIPMCSSSGSSAWFTDVSMSGNLLTVGAHSYVLTSNGWAEYPKSINNNNSINIPSCITTKATIAVQDAYAEWVRIGTLIIGGRGNSSGSISIGVKASVTGSYKFLTDSTFRTKNTNASGSTDNSFEASSVTVSSAQWNILRMIDQYSGTNTVNCTYDINMFDTSSNNPSCFNIKIHKLYDGQSSKLYISATESWGSMS